MSLRVDDTTPPIETIEDFFNGEELEEEPTYEPSYEERKQKIKDAKAQTRERAERKDEDGRAYLVLSFSSFENKEAFCEMLGIPSYEQYVKGEELLSKLE